MADETPSSPPPAKGAEYFTFIFLAFIIWPILTMAVVGGYGFAVWAFQMIAGPPGPPGG